MKWQPIETAPKDRSILLYHPAGSHQDGKYPFPEHIKIGSWWMGDKLNPPQWRDNGMNYPTMWMDLPPMPSEGPPKKGSLEWYALYCPRCEFLLDYCKCALKEGD